MKIEIVNPSNEALINEYDFMSNDEVSTIVDRANLAWEDWRKISLQDRIPYVLKLAEILREKAQYFAELMALEMGKPIKDGLLEIEKCALCCEYYAEHSAAFLKDNKIQTDNLKSYTTLSPLGIILSIMPWNYPFWQVIRHVVPTIISGNVSLLKHAPNVTGCALALEKLFKESMFPSGIFTILRIDVKETGDLIENKKIKAVTLTGSTNAGKAVAAKAGAAIKKVVLELGGNDPYIVLQDADLDLTVKVCSMSRLLNAGQSCIAAKRFIVHENIVEQFEAKLVHQMGLTHFGNPLDDSTAMGPLARKDLRDELHKQVIESINLGAKCLLGGYMPKGKGFFYPPTILTNVKKGMPAYDDEMFGPVASIIKVNNDEHAVEIANDSVYGLGSAIFTKNIAKGEKIAKELMETGMCSINTYNKSIFDMPFGGIKESGYGRELSSHGLTEFMNLKTIVVR